MGAKFVAKSVKSKANFDIDKLKPINHVDKAFIPILFGHAKDDDFITPSHSEALHEAYAGDKNYISFDGDHNSSRPQFFLDSVVIFFLNALQVHSLVPQEKRQYETPDKNLPFLDAFSGYEFDDDDDEVYQHYNQNEVTEEDLIKMAIEQSNITYQEETGNKDDHEEAKD